MSWLEGLISIIEDRHRSARQSQSKVEEAKRIEAELEEYKRDMHTAVYGTEMEKLILSRKYGKKS